jgi:hypothetical protein
VARHLQDRGYQQVADEDNDEDYIRPAAAMVVAVLHFTKQLAIPVGRLAATPPCAVVSAVRHHAAPKPTVLSLPLLAQLQARCHRHHQRSQGKAGESPCIQQGYRMCAACVCGVEAVMPGGDAAAAGT